MWSKKNAVFLYDRKTRCRDVTCVEGMLVQDVINQACHNLDPPIAPIGQFFFGLKDMKTQCYLSPYHPIPPGNRRYQLRVFVSPAQSNFQFQTVSRSLLNYYYHQLKEDFIHDWLYPPVSVNNAIWMVAADMAKEATEKKREFSDFSHPEIWRLSSPSLKEKWKEDGSVGEMLETTFYKFREAYDKFRTSGSGEGEHFPDHFHCRYLEIYEQDDHCNTHLFQLKTTFHRKSRDAVVILAISPKKGLYKFKFKGKKQTDNTHLCKIVDISGVVLDDQAFTATVECANRGGLEPHPLQAQKLHFKSKEDLMSFFAVLDAYYRIKVDANSTVLKVNVDREMEEGSLAPAPKFEGLPNADLFYAPICHEAVRGIFKKFDYPEGHFLIRQSRSHDNSFVLSLCRNQKVLNFRIIKHQDGTLSLCNPRQEEGDQSAEPTFDSLHELIESHKSRRSGLPILLTHIYSPNVTGPIPLVPSEREDDSETCSLVSTSPSIPSLTPELPDHIKELIRDGVTYIDYSEQLKIEAELGSGHFSTVYRGTWNNTKVAVKVPSGLSTTTADLVMKDLTNEIKVMAQLDHPNIVKLHGITSTPHFLGCLKTVTMVVMEFVEGGSLSSYLERIRRNPVPQSPDTIVRDKKLTFLNFSWQIADAMEYLEKQGLVHRDLATRNVLVVSNSQVKVSDFGLARQFKDDKDYYPASNNKDVPIFWFAPECLQPPHKFTNKSDVWSFGVTLWELFSLGDNPKHFLNPLLSKCKSSAEAFSTLVEYYKNPLNRLPQRNHIPSDVYALLCQCWAFSPTDRLPFSLIKDKLSALY